MLITYLCTYENFTLESIVKQILLLPIYIFSVGLREKVFDSFTYFLQIHLNPDIAEKMY